MLNYIKAELWKLSQRRAFYALALVLLLCVAFFLWLFSQGAFAHLTAAISTTMLVGMLLAPPLAQLVDSAAHETLKNERAFGLSLERIYFGKLLAGVILGLCLCLAMVGGCLGLGWLLLPHGTEERVQVSLGVLGFCLLAALPLWCAMLAVCHTLALTVQSTAAWVSGYYLVFFLGQPILLLVLNLLLGGRASTEAYPLLTAILMPYILLMPSYLSGWLAWEYQLWCWAIGLGWTAVSAGVGLLMLHRWGTT